MTGGGDLDWFKNTGGGPAAVIQRGGTWREAFRAAQPQ
jgi:hypothetical protein